MAPLSRFRLDTGSLAASRPGCGRSQEPVRVFRGHHADENHRYLRVLVAGREEGRKLENALSRIMLFVEFVGDCEISGTRGRLPMQIQSNSSGTSFAGRRAISETYEGLKHALRQRSICGYGWDPDRARMRRTQDACPRSRELFLPKVLALSVQRPPRLRSAVNDIAGAGAPQQDEIAPLRQKLAVCPDRVRSPRR